MVTMYPVHKCNSNYFLNSLRFLIVPECQLLRVIDYENSSTQLVEIACYS